MSDNEKLKKIGSIPSLLMGETDEPFLCIVCQRQSVVGETVKKLPCGHAYHDICIDPWLRDHRTCPVCTKTVY